MMKSHTDIWAFFSLQEQHVLLWLSPFQYGFYYDFQKIKDFLIPLQKFQGRKDDLEEDFYSLLQKCLSLGLFRQDPGELAYMLVQPFFWHIIKKNLAEQANPSLKTIIRQRFLNYYENLASELYLLLKSGVPADYQQALDILSLEYLNLLEACREALFEVQKLTIFTTLIGRYLTSQNRLEEKLQWQKGLEQQLNTSGKESYLTEYISLMDGIGNTLLEMHRKEEARNIFRKAINLCGQVEEEATMLRFKGILYTNLGLSANDQKEMLGWMEKAYHIADQAEDFKQKGSIAFNLSEAYFEASQYDRSEAYLSIALELFQVEKQYHKRIQVYQSMSSRLQKSGQFEAAKEKLMEALEIAETLDDALQKGAIYQDLASLNFRIDDLQESETHCKMAIDQFLLAKEIRQQANAYNLLSVISFECNELLEGMEYAEKALALFHQAEDKVQMAQTYTNIALVCYEEGWFPEAIIELQKAMKLFLERGNRFGIEKSRILLASCYFGKEDFQQGQEELQKALKYFVKVGEESEIQHCLNLAEFVHEQQPDSRFQQKIKAIIADASPR